MKKIIFFYDEKIKCWIVALKKKFGQNNIQLRASIKQGRKKFSSNLLNEVIKVKKKLRALRVVNRFLSLGFYRFIQN